MKEIIKTIIVISILIQGCGLDQSELNTFSSASDTLILRTQKHKDRGPFLSSHVPVAFKDIPNDLQSEFIVPDGLIEIKSLYLSADYGQENPDYIDIISGSYDNREIYIVDENNNNNFKDDSVCCKT